MASRPIHLERVAIIQRQMLWLLLLLISLMVGDYVSGSGVYSVGFEFMWYGVHLGALVQACRLVRAMGGSIAAVVVTGLFMALPGVNFLAILITDMEASRMLRESGVRSGLMGARSDQMNKLKEGVCNGCGYSQAGLDGVRCPECGLEKPMARETLGAESA